jgi:hypothetical protein
MKDEVSNLNFMIIVLKFVVSCEVLTLEESFQVTNSGHVISKACQYVTTNEKKIWKLQICFMKFEQAKLAKVHNLAQKV